MTNQKNSFNTPEEGREFKSILDSERKVNEKKLRSMNYLHEASWHLNMEMRRSCGEEEEWTRQLETHQAKQV
jgi:hypothetical protein